MARNMKDSGIEWIGEIPEGWEVAPLKRFTSIQTGNTPSKTSDSNYYASTGIPWIKPDNLGYSHSISKTSEHLTSEGALCARIMPPNTVYVCCIGSLGKVGYSSISCACNQQINALIFNDLMFWKYGYYLTIAQESQYLLFGNGNVLQIINSTSQGNIACVLPPLENQHLIACYLDSVCSDIEVLISKTRSSIEEYKKLKQAVITQAVTKTIYDDFGNPSKFRKLRSLCDVLSKGTTPKDIETQNDEFYCIRYLKSENIVSNQLNLNPTFFITAETNNSLERSKLNSGDILFVIAGASIGKVAITTADFLPANTNQAVAFIRLSSSYQYATKYIWYFLQSDVVKQLIALSAVQSAQPNLSLEDLGAMRLPLPDQMGCLKITDYLDAKCAEIDKLIAKKEQLVKELESYKKSLIYEVVTGKREV